MNPRGSGRGAMRRASRAVGVGQNGASKVLKSSKTIRRLPQEAGFRSHSGASSRCRADARHADVRGPPPRGSESPLRPSPGNGGSPQVLGRAPGILLRPEGEAPRRSHRGPSPDVRNLRRRHSQRRVRRGHHDHLGPGALRALESRRRPTGDVRGKARSGASRKKAPRGVAPGEDPLGEGRVDPVQGPGPLRARGVGEGAFLRSLARDRGTAPGPHRADARGSRTSSLLRSRVGLRSGVRRTAGRAPQGGRRAIGPVDYERRRHFSIARRRS